MIVLVGALSLIVIICVVKIIRSERELRRMTQFLEKSGDVSNARILVETRSKGFVGLGAAINNQLDKRQQELIASRVSQRDFHEGFSRLSHDIRTPLAGAQGYLQLLEEEEDIDVAKKYHSIIKKRLFDLKQLLDQLFLFTQVSDADYSANCSAISLSEITGEVLVSFYPEFENRSLHPFISLQEGEGGMVWANSDATKRILENLTVNMLRHGQSDFRIEQQDNQVTFSNQVEHPEDIDKDRLFERFYRGEKDASEKGSGLGLAIVAHLAEAMGANAIASLEGNQLSFLVRFGSAIKQEIE